MLILQKVSEDEEFREKDRLKHESRSKEAESTSGENIVMLVVQWSNWLRLAACVHIVNCGVCVYVCK